MSSKTPYRDVLAHHVHNQERTEDASSESKDPLQALVRLLARQAAREWLTTGPDEKPGPAGSYLPPGQDHDR